uniref:Uncharacterized protein n=1 Tax=Triticum urartu TaxID=4572 RepID=A0A8R7QZW6_TRIUA
HVASASSSSAPSATAAFNPVSSGSGKSSPSPLPSPTANLPRDRCRPCDRLRRRRTLLVRANSSRDLHDRMKHGSHNCIFTQGKGN